MAPNVARKAGRQARVTTTPETEPPLVRCASCDNPLTFLHATFGGVKPEERWDSYVCKECGIGFEYRHRTHKLRRLG